MKFIKNLNQLNKSNVHTAGGKGANLGELVKIEMPVPEGFVLLASAFERFLEKTDIDVEIEAMWRKINIKDIESVEENSEIVRALILKAKIPKDLEKEIVENYYKLSNLVPMLRSIGTRKKNFFVAVRSSATAEDSKIDAWAGQLETYLNTTKENLGENIKKCWASLYGPRALFYRVKRGLRRKKVSVAVVVQGMVQSEVSGVCFTTHPVTKDKNQMIIEACWGLGEALVSGKITPDSYVVDERNFKILDINLNSQERMIIRDKKGTKTTIVPKSKVNKQKLPKNQIIELAKLCQKIEAHYKDPQDIEWAFGKAQAKALNKNKFYITQSRPITTL